MVETKENKMENTMNEMSMQGDSMDSSMSKMNDDSMMEMEAMPKMNKMSHMDITMGLINNYIIDLEKELKSAKLRYAEADLDDENWSGKYERRTACKVIEGKIKVLNEFQNNLESMFENMPMQ